MCFDGASFPSRVTNVFGAFILYVQTATQIFRHKCTLINIFLINENSSSPLPVYDFLERVFFLLL